MSVISFCLDIIIANNYRYGSKKSLDICLEILVAVPDSLSLTFLLIAVLIEKARTIMTNS